MKGDGIIEEILDDLGSATLAISSSSLFIDYIVSGVHPPFSLTTLDAAIAAYAVQSLPALHEAPPEREGRGYPHAHPQQGNLRSRWSLGGSEQMGGR